MGDDARIMSGMPLLPLLTAFIAGVIAVRYFPEAIIYGAAVMAVLCVFLWVRHSWLAGGVCLFALFGMTAMWLSMPPKILFDAPGDAVEYRGVVDEVKATPYNQSLTIVVDDYGGRSIKVLARYHDVEPWIEEGDMVRFKSVLHPVGEGAIVPDEFSMKDFAFRRGVSAECHVAQDDLIVDGEVWSLSSFFAGIRRVLSDYIYERSGLTPETAYMLEAMLTGNAYSISPERRDSFSGAGLAHVLALSGTHVAVISFIVAMAFFPLRMAGHSRWEPWCVLTVLWGYVLLTGCTPSVVRTVVMASAVACGRMLRRGSNPFNNLCFAALIILLFDP